MRVFLLTCLISLSLSASEHFPIQGIVKAKVAFWKNIYTQVNSNQGVLHDAKNVSIVYQKLDLPADRRASIRLVKKEKQKIVLMLKGILKKKFKNLNQAESRIISMMQEKTQARLKDMIKWVRLQRGLKDRYYRGLIRSYKYMEFIKKTFKEMGLPSELVYLPHVESSFNYKAYSKVGAAGIWQFMRATARRFGLKVGYIIDERRDPLKATVAAAKLLKANYKKLGSWPLALTAYNHGARSMERAVAKLGTKNIAQIIERYDGRRFGFASKNFYATFMATVEISQNPDKYFPSFKVPSKFDYSEIILSRSYQIKHLTKTLELPRDVLREYNPAIRKMAFNSSLFLPKNLKLQIPPKNAKQLEVLQQKLNQLKIPSSDFELDKLHIVSRGESLFTISRLYAVDMNRIIQFNRISDPTRIYPGMKLKIPGKKTKVTITIPPVVALPSSPPEPNMESLEEVISPVEVKKIKRKIPRTKTLNEIVSQYFKGLFQTSEDKASAPPPLQEANNDKVNLSSYQLDLTVISPDIYEMTVETEETIGHYGEWARVPTQVIRDLNGLGKTSQIKLGEKIKIRIYTEQLTHFKDQRNEYHSSIQEDFYDEYSIEGYTSYFIKAGDNLSHIIQRYSLPFWLLRKSQDNGRLDPMLKVGDKILIPKINSESETHPVTSQES